MRHGYSGLWNDLTFSDRHLLLIHTVIFGIERQLALRFFVLRTVSLFIVDWLRLDEALVVLLDWLLLLSVSHAELCGRVAAQFLSNIALRADLNIFSLFIQHHSPLALIHALRSRLQLSLTVLQHVFCPFVRLIVKLWH